MTKSPSRKEQIRNLLKQKNISIAVLAMHIGKSRGSLNSVLKSPHSLSEEDFKYYKKSIESIDTENYYEKYVRGAELPKKELIPSENDHKQKIRDFLNEHNIKAPFAALICGRTRASFSSLINRSSIQRISDDLYMEIISKLEEYVKNRDANK
ncbi:MAG: hypothetical protein QY331_07560 [Melioribacteraceae bacterium]|nr:MAG: hypothetical protein QY331_07560 [Melioribacteraceae bacterium]